MSGPLGFRLGEPSRSSETVDSRQDQGELPVVSLSNHERGSAMLPGWARSSRSSPTSAPARGIPAQMKAVLLRAHPGARLVDLSHEVPRLRRARGRAPPRGVRALVRAGRDPRRGRRSRRRDRAARALRRRSGGPPPRRPGQRPAHVHSSRRAAHPPSRSRPARPCRRRVARPSTAGISSRRPPPISPRVMRPSGSARR